MNLKKHLSIFVVVVSTMAACSKTSPDSSTFKTDPTPIVVTPPAADIYILGTTTTGNVYWKNGVATALNGFSGYTCTAIAVSGTDVYVTGTMKSGTGVNTAAYWKNGTVTTLSDGIKSTQTTAIALSGTDLYIAGYTDNVIVGGHIQNKTAAYYWKNGVATELSDTSMYGRASSIAIDNNNVYVAGASGSSAVYWKNGILTKLSDGSTNAAAIAIAISNGDVYAGGFVTINNSNPAVNGVYWKNGTTITINDPGLDPVQALAVSGPDVYAAGYASGPYAQNAAFWKNGVITELPAPAVSTNNLLISGIAVNGSDVYVTENNGYWKNTTYVQLPDCTGTSGIAIVLR